MEEDEDLVMGDAPVSHRVPVQSGMTAEPSSRDEEGHGPLKRDASTESSHLYSQNGRPQRGQSVPSCETPGLGGYSAPVPNSGDPTWRDVARSVEQDMPAARSSEDSDSMLEVNSDWSSDESMPISSGLPLASLATGYCYDVRMRYHCQVQASADPHPEDPRRILYIYKELCYAGLIYDSKLSPSTLAPRPMQRIEIRDATQEEIQLVHTPDHYAFVESTKDFSDEDLLNLEKTGNSIYYNRLSFSAALLSAGGAIETCLAVARRQVRNAIAVIRPPGHHAECDQSMGFCFFNNVSIAAKVCQRQLGDACRKIMILDWDAHHGNGIQKAFYDDPDVLYISLHVYEDGRFYPGGPEGNYDHIGEGLGIGKNVNIPWPSQGMGDGDYMYAFQHVVMPIATEFDPDLVIVASGFDAAAGDELGGCFVTPACYAHMTHMLMTLANGKVAVCLEGGYNFRAISKSAVAVAKTLMGEPPDRLEATKASRAAVQVVNQVRTTLSRYWKCMYPKAPIQEGLFTDRFHDIIRAYQAKQLYESHKLTSLWIYRTTISKSFENQVLASPNYDQAVPLLVIFHDPPEIMGIHHPITHRLEAHNCWLADIVKDYVAWAVGKGYGVIDVNIPKHVTMQDGIGKYEDEDENRPHATEELASYLWDNYIEPNEATHIFFLGVGDAFYGVANLLINRDSIYQRVNSVISFVADNPVRAVASPTQVWLSRWYKENSLVFVSHTHGVWNNSENRRKPSKRYGRLIQSPRTGLNEMLLHHKQEVFKWIEERVTADEEDDVSEES